MKISDLLCLRFFLESVNEIELIFSCDLLISVPQAILPELKKELSEVMKEGVNKEELREVKQSLKQMGLDVEVKYTRRALWRHCNCLRFTFFDAF